MNNYILSEYDKFKTFMKYTDLPEFETVYNENAEYTARASFEDKTTLCIGKGLFARSADEKTAVLFREFTRIHDRHILSGDVRLYAEYHAAQVSTLFLDSKDKIDAADHIIAMIMSYAKFHDYFMTNPSPKAFRYLKNYYMNILGSIDALNQRSEYHYPVPKFCTDIDTKMSDIYKVLTPLQYKEIPSQEILQKIRDIEMKTNKKIKLELFG